MCLMSPTLALLLRRFVTPTFDAKFSSIETKLDALGSKIDSTVSASQGAIVVALLVALVIAIVGLRIDKK